MLALKFGGRAMAFLKVNIYGNRKYSKFHFRFVLYKLGSYLDWITVTIFYVTIFGSHSICNMFPYFKLDLIRTTSPSIFS